MSVVTVSNSIELTLALDSAQGGDVIHLSTGNYGGLDLSGLNFSSEVTITSASGGTASISAMRVSDCSNITFDNILFDYEAESDPWQSERPFEIAGSSAITISNSTFDGDIADSSDAQADGFGTGIGLYVHDSQDINIEDNTFTKWYRGAFFTETDGLVISENELHDIRSDGMNFAAVTDVLIEGNYFHDFHLSTSSGDHADMIQFWTTNTTTPTTNVVIRGNVLDVGDGDATQSIFMRNEVVDKGQAGSEMFYQNIVIEDNVIKNNHLHGISVGETDGLTIQNNTLVTTATYFDTILIPQIRVSEDSVDVTIVENTVRRINPAPQPEDWEVSDNTLTQNTDPDAPNYSFDIDVDALIEALLGIDYTSVPTNLEDEPITGSEGAEQYVLEDGPVSDQTSSSMDANDVATGGDGADRFSFHGGRISANEVDIITDLVFSEGDTIGFSGFEKGFFSKESGAFSNGTGAIINSVDDIRALHDLPGVNIYELSGGGTQIVIQGNEQLKINLESVAFSELGIVSDDASAEPEPTTDPQVTADPADTTEPADTTDGTWNFINGGKGEDRLRSTSESDVMTGGNNADRFSFHGERFSEGETDIITDLSFSEGDTIGFSGFESGFFAGINGSFAGGTGIVINSYDDIGNLARLEGVSVSELDNGGVLLEIAGNEDFMLELTAIDYDMIA